MKSSRGSSKDVAKAKAVAMVCVPMLHTTSKKRMPLKYSNVKNAFRPRGNIKMETQADLSSKIKTKSKIKKTSKS